VVARWFPSTKLLYAGPGLVLVRVISVCNQPLRPTQPSTLSGTENEYLPKCGDALRLGSKGRYVSFHLWINVWEQVKLCDHSLTCTIPERFRDELLMIKCYTSLRLLTLLTDDVQDYFCLAYFRTGYLNMTSLE